MINRYDEFLIESLLLESVIGFSDKFKEVINKIDNPITNLLLNAENKDLDINMTQIDVSDIDGMLNFSPENKSPQVIKVGRLIRILLFANGQEVSDKDIEVYTYAYREAILGNNNIEDLFDIVKGDDIVEYYRSDRTEAHGMGTLNSSCMRNSSRGILEIYTSSENVEMLILRSSKDNTKIVGRAILWTLIGSIFSAKLEDHVYVSRLNPKYFEMIPNYSITTISYE